MPRLLGLAVLLLALPACPSAEGPPDESPSIVTALVAAYDSAWSAKDTASVGRLLAPDYAYFTSTGRLSSRAATLGFLMDTSYVLTRAVRSELDVRVTGHVARVVSRWEGTGRFQGQPVQDDQTCGQTWIWHESVWRLFTEHCVNRPVPK